jgi:hypothetical protein
MKTVADELREAWRGRTAARNEFGGTYRPIADSAEDQISAEGHDNPLWDIVRWMPAETYLDGGSLEPTYLSSAFDHETANRLSVAGATRQYLATHYTWSIISPGDIGWMSKVLDGRGVVEVGAGTGYRAWQLEQAGIDVAAYDPFPPSEENRYCKGGPYTTVLSGDASAAKHHPDRALLMVWPPYGGHSARHALSVYTGDLLIYAGEGFGGCTADDDFYELLAAEWTEVSSSPCHVTWWGIHCRLAAYRRRGGQR